MAPFRALDDLVAVHIEPERRHGAGAAVQIRPESRIAVPHARNQSGIGSVSKRTFPRRLKDGGGRDAHPPAGGASGFAHADRIPKPMQPPDDQSRGTEFSPARFRVGMEVAPPRRQLWEHGGKRVLQKRQRGNRHRRTSPGLSRPRNGYSKNDNGISECYDKGNNLSIFSEPYSASPERFPSRKETARFTKIYTPISLKP